MCSRLYLDPYQLILCQQYAAIAGETLLWYWSLPKTNSTESALASYLLVSGRPAAPESVVSVNRTNLSAPLPCGQKREDALADGNFADTSLGLAVPDVNIALADLYVLRPQGQILPDAKTRIYQNQYVLDSIVISLLPKPVDFSGRERSLFVDDAVPVNLDIS